MRLSYESVTDCLGPGKRYVIWVQGCNKRCDGCINPDGRDLDGGYEKSIEVIKSSILCAVGITGITVSGGEPFLQYSELKELVIWLKENTQLDVLLYSGYTREEINTMYPDCEQSLFTLVDIFVDGEYRKELNNGSAYRGSDNQRIYFFTPKYREIKENILTSKERKISFDLRENGDVYFIGIPPKGLYEKFLKKLGG